MNTYTIVRCPDKPDWEKIPAANIDIWHETKPMPVSARAQVCYDDTALYVRLSAKEENIRAEYHGLLDEVSDDSCLEFFFSPIEGDRRYFNIEVNPNGAMYLGFGPNVHQLVRLVPEEPAICPKILRTSSGWEVSYQIPYTFIRQFFPTFSPVPGSKIRGNFFKCAGKGEPPHFLCWCPVVPQMCAFHNPDCFGTLIFA